MVTLDQIKLLESKISQAIEYFTRLTEENAWQQRQNDELQLQNNELQQQNDELRETIIQLKEEKTRMDEGIASALGKFNQFEDNIEKNLKPSITLIPPQHQHSVASAYVIDEDEDPVIVDIVDDDTAVDDFANADDDGDDDVGADNYEEEATEVLDLDADDSSFALSNEDDGKEDDDAIEDAAAEENDDTKENDDTEDQGEAELDIF
jgi:FtsZ-binding cell division protein ZapB